MPLLNSILLQHKKKNQHDNNKSTRHNERELTNLEYGSIYFVTLEKLR